MRNKKGVSPVLGVILTVLIAAAVAAAAVAIFVFGLGGGNTQTNESLKNPNIQYYEKNTVKISGNNSDELAKNVAEMRKGDCWIDDIAVIPEVINNDDGTIKSSIIARTSSCGAKYK